MRVRFDKNAENKLKESNIYIENPAIYKGIWKDIFENNNEIHIEIGMGKGDFLVEYAKINPDINYIGLERNISILAKACSKILKEKIENIKLISIDADKLKDVFEYQELDKIYLNFSDPWPKNKHCKRRLTYRSFLDLYKYILKENKVIEFKTDNQVLFESTIIEVANTKREIEYISLDLHNTDTFNIMTEYERKFSSKGNKIYKLIWKN